MPFRPQPARHAMTALRLYRALAGGGGQLGQRRLQPVNRRVVVGRRSPMRRRAWPAQRWGADGRHVKAARRQCRGESSARCGSPTTSGMIWLAERSVSQPCFESRTRRPPGPGKQILATPRLLAHDRERRGCRRASGRRRAPSKKYSRARLTSQSIRFFLPHTKPPTPPALAKRADSNIDAWADAQILGHAAPLRPKTPVAVVHHQHRLMPLREVGDLDQRGQVAIHAVKGVGHDQPSPCVARFIEQLFEVVANRCADKRKSRPATAGNRRSSWHDSSHRPGCNRRATPAP